MSSVDMCQCAGCFESRQAVDRWQREIRLREKIAELKARLTQTAESKKYVHPCDGCSCDTKCLALS